MRRAPSPLRAAPWLAAGLCLLLAAASCRSTSEPPPEDEASEAPDPDGPLPPSLEPIVIPNPRAGSREGLRGTVRDKRPVDEKDAGWAEKFEVASGYASGGFDDEAIAVIRAVLAQDPPARWKERFGSLRTSLRVRALESELLRVDARGYRDYVEFGADVDWRVRIRNVSGRTLVFKPPVSGPGGTSPSAVSLAVTRRDIDIYGSELLRTWNQTVYLQQAGGCEVRIQPGSSYEVPARIPAADVGASLQGIRVLELRGTFRGTVEDGEGEAAGGIGLDIRPGRVVVLPAGYEPLASAPLEAMAAALDAVAPTHLLIATEFVPRRDSAAALEILARALGEGEPALHTAALGGLSLLRERNAGRPVDPFLRPLVDALDQHPQRRDAVMQGLTRMTGHTLAPDPRLWLDWWRRARRDGASIPETQRRETSGEGGGGR